MEDLKVLSDDGIKVSDIEVYQTLINPISSFKYILGLEFPSKEAQYINVIYNNLNEIFDQLFNVEVIKTSIDLMLQQNEIDIDMYKKIFNFHLGKRVAIYSDYICKLQPSLIQMYHSIISFMKNIDTIEDVIDSMKDALTAVNIKSVLILLDVEKLGGISNDSASMYAIMITKLINKIVSFMVLDDDDIDDDSEEEQEGDTMGKTTEKVTRFVTEGNETKIKIEEVDKVKINTSAKDREVNNMADAVNLLDSDFGVNPYSPKETLDDKTGYSVYMQNIKTQLKMLGIMIAEIPVDEDDPESSKYNKKALFNSPLFSDNIHRNSDDRIFRLKMYSQILLYCVNNLGLINISLYNVNDKKKNKFHEYTAKTAYLYEISNRLCSLEKSFTKGKNYEDDLLFFYEVIQTSRLNNKYDTRNYRKAVEKIHEQGSYISESLKPSLFKKKKESKEVTFDTLVKLAYILVTGDNDVKGLVPIIFDKELDSDIVKRILTDLGEQILDKEYDRYSLYAFYKRSNPSLWVKWSDALTDRYLAEGCFAIDYLCMILNDRGVSSFMNKMIR